jgi:hypothetical protein
LKARDVFAGPSGHRRVLTAVVAVLGVVLAFGVAFAAATAPVVTVENATNVEYTTADVEGTVNPEGQGTSWRFQYATEADFSNSQEGPSGFTETAEPVGGQLTGLHPGTTYHLRLLAENGDGQNEAVAASTFTTKTVTKPTPGEPQISSLTGKTAHFEGTVDPNAPADNSALSQAAKDAFATHWWFTCQPACSFSGPSEGDIEADNDPVTVAADATGLGGNSEYTVTLHVQNAAGEETAQSQFTTIVIKPEVTGSLLNAFNPGDTFATIAGAVNPENSETDCRFVYGIGGASGNEVPCSPPHALLDEEQSIFVNASSGQFRLSFESEATEDLPFDVGPVAVQEALEALPAIGPDNVAVIDTLARKNITRTSGFDVTFDGPLSGKNLPPLGAEDGTVPLQNGEDEEGKPTPGTVSVETVRDGSSTQSTPVTARLSGLAPEAEYSYKIVATNAGGTTEGPEQAFTTLGSPPGETGCSNASVRAEQHSASGECRGFELVSPTDKNGGMVAGEGDSVFAATAGDAAVFQSRGGFPGTTGSGATGFTQYLSRRGAAGWTTKSITPTPAKSWQQVILGGTEQFFFSDDLRKAILKAYDLPGPSDDVANIFNLYRQDTETGALETVSLGTQKQGPIPFEPTTLLIPTTYGASADTGVAYYASEAQHHPPASPEVLNAYEWDHGTLRLAGILPNGEVPSGGSTPPVFQGGSSGEGYRATVSSDGSRVIFAAPASGSQQIYLRRNHNDTVWVSESESAVPVAEPENVQLDWVSADAHKILFSTTSKLLNEDENEGSDVYLYTDSPDPKSETNQELISEDGMSGIVVGVSNDASRIYISGGGTVFLWEGGHERVALNVGDAGEANRESVMSASGRWRVSADGRYLAVRSARLGAYESLTGQKVADNLQMYVYDAVNQTLTCASCLANGATRGGVPEEPQVNRGVISKPAHQLRPRFLSADGRRVFFSTAAPLLSADTNGVMDVYVYDTRTGHLQLVSNGNGEDPAWFANADNSGDNALFLTGQRIVGADKDTLTDLYDSRVNGGFNEPPPPPTPCSGDNCRTPLSTAPQERSPATAAFSGPGNGHGKVKRHHKKHQKNHHRRHQKKHRAHRPTVERGGHR